MKLDQKSLRSQRHIGVISLCLSLISSSPIKSSHLHKHTEMQKGRRERRSQWQHCTCWKRSPMVSNSGPQLCSGAPSLLLSPLSLQFSYSKVDQNPQQTSLQHDRRGIILAWWFGVNLTPQCHWIQLPYQTNSRFWAEMMKERCRDGH